jgi:hypothetical protein
MKTATATVTGGSPDRSAYDSDFFNWTQRTARLLRERRFDQLDIAHAAEEIEDMGRRDFREVCGRLEVLLLHLLKWKLQGGRRSTSWRRTIVSQRIEIARVLEQSPSIKPRLRRELERAHQHAVKLAMVETRLPAQRFPRECPFSFEQILDDDYLPD